MVRKYTPEHEWIEINGDEATIGITHFAQAALGDVVFVDLPQPGRSVGARQGAAVVESVKAASDVYAPLAGTITAVNGALVNDPSLVNRDPENSGWFFKLKLTNPSATEGLLDHDAYQAHVRALG